MHEAQLENIESAINQLPLLEQRQLLAKLARRIQQQGADQWDGETQFEESNFRHLVEQWRRETEHVSSLKQACLHPAYQRIIGLGPAAVPHLLRELEQRPDHWFWALHAITGEDPAHGEDTLAGATQAWLAWGREKGYL